MVEGLKTITINGSLKAKITNEKKQNLDTKAQIPVNRNIWPNKLQTDLLHATLLPDERAISAWTSWIEQVDIDYLDYSSYRMLPVLYDNLKRLGVEHPEMGRLKGVYRRHWLSNQVMLQQIRPIMTALTEQGMNPVIFKGLSASLRYYKNVGLRPMLDVDILLPKEQIEAALDSMHQHGWEPIYDVRQRNFIFHAVGLSNRQFPNFEIDLHWALLRENTTGSTFDSIRQYIIPFEHKERTYQVLTPTVDLFVTCIHGSRYSGGSRLHWIADVHRLLDTHGSEIDWSLLLDFAEQFGVALRLLTALSILQEVTTLEIPPAIISKLSSREFTLADKTKNFFLSRKNLPVVGGIVRKYIWYQELNGDQFKVNNFADYLRLVWDLEDGEPLRKEGFSRMMKAIGKRS